MRQVRWRISQSARSETAKYPSATHSNGPHKSTQPVPIPHVGSWRYHVANLGPLSTPHHSAIQCRAAKASRIHFPYTHSQTNVSSHVLPNLFGVSPFTPRVQCTLLWFFPLCPREHWPSLAPRERLEPPRRIHRHRLPNRFEHPSITDAISVRIALRQLKSIFHGQLPRGASLCLSEHRISKNPPRPPPIFLFQPRSANRHGSRDSTHCQPHHQRQRHLLRQRR